MAQQINPNPSEFDLDALLQDEADGKLPTDAAEMLKVWRAEGSIPPPRLPSAPTSPIGGPGFAGRVGRATRDFVTDPTTSLPAVGGFLGGAAGGVATRSGTGVRLGTAAGQMAGRYAGEAIKQRDLTPDVGAGTLGFEALTGAVMPTGRVVSGQALRKLPMTPLGKETLETLGDKAMIPDLVESPGWEFGRNIAKEGFFGRRGMQQREHETGELLLNKSRELAEKELPTPPSGSIGPNTVAAPFNSDRSVAGREAQTQLRDQYVTEQGKASELYNPWMSLYGDVLIESGADDAVPKITMAQLHARRSAALKAGRHASANNDYSGFAAAAKEANTVQDMMENTLGPDAMRQYNSISNQYGEVMSQYDNPFVQWMREGNPEEKFVDILLNPDRIQTFVPYREMTVGSGRTAGEKLVTHKAVSQEEAVHLLRAALGEEKFAQLRADSIFHMSQGTAKQSDSGTEYLAGREMVTALEKMPAQVQRALFGPAAAENINTLARVAAHTQRSREGTGALWIVMRQPSAALGIATAATGMGTGNTMLGLTSGGVILLAPKVMSAILRSKKATQLFVQVANAKAPDIKQRLIKELTAQVVRGTAIGGTRATQSAFNMEPGKSTTFGQYVPEPPTQGIPP